MHSKFLKECIFLAYFQIDTKRLREVEYFLW
jgi:hypothetical protein